MSVFFLGVDPRWCSRGSVFVVLPRPTIIDSDEVYLVELTQQRNISLVNFKEQVVCLLRNVIMKCSAGICLLFRLFKRWFGLI